MASDFIPVSVPLLDGNEEAYVVDCIRTGWISSEGPYVKKFESSMAEYHSRSQAVAVANGTAALEVATVAAGIGNGDEVILPSFTIISCAQAVVKAGATPVVVDSLPDTWCMDPSAVEAAITPRTKAIMVVHMYGMPCEMDRLTAIAKAHGLLIIEDTAEAIGLYYRGRPCGSFGDIATFSFYANKHVTTGEGGMILTDNPQIAERCRELRNLCFQPKARFVHEELGWNYRLSNVLAAIGLAQLEKLPDHAAIKRRQGLRYHEAFADLPVTRPLPGVDGAENCYWVYGMVLDDDVPCDAAEMSKRLAAHGVGTRPFFWPMHEQPVFRRMGLFHGLELPVAERLARRGLYVPSGIGLTDSEQDRVIASVRTVFNGGL